MRTALALAALLSFSSLAGCGFSTAKAPPPTPGQEALSQRRVPDLEVRGLLLLLADRKIYEVLTVERALEGDAELRRDLALVLGRVPSRRSLPVLKALALDDDASVRRAAVFSLGMLEAADGVEVLLRAVRDSDRAVGQAAVEALGRVGVSPVDVGESLAELGQDEFWRRLLPSLHLFQGDAVPPLAQLGFEQAPGPVERAWAAYSLGRLGIPETAEILRDLLHDDDPWIQAQAIVGLDRLGGFTELELLRPLVSPEAEHEGPAIAALDLAARRIGAGAVAPPDDWRESLGKLLADPRPGLQLAAARAAGAWLLDDSLSGILIEMSREDGALGRAALLSLADARHPRAVELVAAAVASAEESRRAGAVGAAVVLGLDEVLETLGTDPSPRVREEVLRVWLVERGEGARDLEGTELEGARVLVRRALDDSDPGIRATALSWLGSFPVLPVKELMVAARGARLDRVPETRILAVGALVARAQRAPSEEQEILEGLLELAADGDFLLRREAAEAIRTLGYRPPPVGPVRTGRTAAVYEDMVLQSREVRRVRIRTEAGPLTFEIDCPQAPLSCLSFLQLATQGFYDGLSFHHLEPGVLIQGGDPRGDGRGGPGYTLRDEIHPAPFERGTLGLAKPAPDAAGSQVFVTLSRQPSLDGRYTVLGRLVEGEERLDLLGPGAPILGMDVLP